MRCVYLCALLVASLVLGHGSWAQPPRFERILTDASQTPNFIGSINAIAQDDSGFIWLGGDNGIARYDGRQFRAYQQDVVKPRALLGHFVQALVVDKSGELWVGTGLGLNRYVAATDDFDYWTFSTEQQVAGARQETVDVRALAVDADNNLYVGTSTGLYILDSKRDSSVFFPGVMGDVDALYISTGGRLWIGLREGGIRLMDIKQRE